MNELKAGSIVTINLENANASNTFIVHEVLSDGSVLLEHPLFNEIIVRHHKEDLNTVVANIKDSTEKCLDFAKNRSDFLDYNMKGDLDALCMYFIVKRQLTPRQKSTLSRICGVIAAIEFNDSLQDAMNFISKNEAMLDDFNRMWYNNFQGLFKGKQAITSNKQRASIFNMAGFVLAELTNPKASK